MAYRRNGWNTEFVTERPGVTRAHDINVRKGRRRWAVECKRTDRSSYDAREKARGERLAGPAHALALANNRSIIVNIAFVAELDIVPDDYLAKRVAAYLHGTGPHRWTDNQGTGTIREIDWPLAHNVLAIDDVYFGSSRMIELLVGHYDHDCAHSMTAKWRPGRGRALWASAIYQASVVRWRSLSKEAVRKKAKHFRAIVAKAARQLPQDRPGVVHVGVETWSGGDVDGVRHFRNMLEMKLFDPGATRLRWVYGEYFSPEVSTRSDESWAVEETSASYRIGQHHTPEPLPDHMLLSPEQQINHGVHWDPSSQFPLRRR